MKAPSRRIEDPLRARSLRRRSRRVQLYLPATMLCLVAAWHAYRVVNHDLTPWKGGGFGMFSSVDAGTNRVVRITLHGRTGSFEAEVPTRKGLFDYLRRVPDPLALDEYLRGLATEIWVPRDMPRANRIAREFDRRFSRLSSDDQDGSRGREQVFEAPSPDETPRGPARRPRAFTWRAGEILPTTVVLPTRIEIAVYREVYDEAEDRLSLELIRSREIEGPGEPSLRERLGRPESEVIFL